MAFLSLSDAQDLLAIGGLSGHYVHPETQETLEAAIQADLDLVSSLIRAGLEQSGYGESAIPSGSDAERILSDLARRLFRAQAYKRGQHAVTPISVIEDEREARKALGSLSKLPGLVQAPSRSAMSWGSQTAKFHHSRTRGY